ncbi:flagellar-specific ATPase [[Clostridium] ultunense Esp]|nr:flagellar-specific ATPase [[Clostridium] ultunense Esp]
MSNAGILSKYKEVVKKVNPIRRNGYVSKVIGLTVESQGPESRIGEICLIYPREGVPIQAEVVGFREEKVLLMPLGELGAIGPGAEVRATGRPLEIRIGNMKGRILDGLGRAMDGKQIRPTGDWIHVERKPPNPLSRPRITQPITVGVRAIDGLLTLGKGQRIGIFAGSGVGKSTLLGMIARNTSADVNVIALIGERGREVKEFIERDLGEEGLKRSMVVAVPSDQPALLRMKGAYVATAIAEYYRDQGLDVMLMMDSVTRFAMAGREVGLAIGEPPATKGYPPSVFANLPKLLERSGTSEKGTITAFYTVLVDSDDMNEPIADAVRGILDGHIVLSRDLANRGHFPAIDVLESVSRLMTEVTSPEHQEKARQVRRLLSAYQEAEDLISIGAYRRGSNRETDLAIAMKPKLDQFLRQRVDERPTFEETLQFLQTEI